MNKWHKLNLEYLIFALNAVTLSEKLYWQARANWAKKHLEG